MYLIETFSRFHARNVYSYTCIRFIEGELVLAHSMTSTVHDLDPHFAKALEKQKKLRVNNQGKIWSVLNHSWISIFQESTRRRTKISTSPGTITADNQTRRRKPMDSLTRISRARNAVNSVILHATVSPTTTMQMFLKPNASPGI